MTTEKQRKQIGEQLKSHRLKKGFSAKEFASKLNINPATVTKIEKGYWNFSIEYLLKFTNQLDLELIIKEK